MDDKIVKIETYYAKKGPFQKGIQMLRKLASSTELDETLKWGVPVYTFQNKNVLGIIAFSSYFGLWFYNGSFLKDPHKVLENAQEGENNSHEALEIQVGGGDQSGKNTCLYKGGHCKPKTGTHPCCAKEQRNRPS